MRSRRLTKRLERYNLAVCITAKTLDNCQRKVQRLETNRGKNRKFISRAKQASADGTTADGEGVGGVWAGRMRSRAAGEAPGAADGPGDTGVFQSAAGNCARE